MEDISYKEALPKEVAKMTAFIQQEADEKARELRIRADEEYSVEKARLVRQDSVQVEAMVAKKLREGETKRKVTESSQANKERLKILTERDNLMRSVFDEAKSRLKLITDDQDKYKHLLRDLIEQSVGKMEGEKELVIECRPADQDIIDSLVKSLSIESTSLTIYPLLKDSSAGGVCVCTKSGKIRCDNTIESRLSFAIEGLLPDLRVQIFGASENRKFND